MESELERKETREWYMNRAVIFAICPFVCLVLFTMGCSVGGRLGTGSDMQDVSNRTDTMVVPTDPCAPEVLGKSYVGCEYFATVTANAVDGVYDFAVTISNSSTTEASVTIEGGALTQARSIRVPANGVRVEQLPWVDALKPCSVPQTREQCFATLATEVVRTGAYHIRSTVPVTVYQFNPLQYTGEGNIAEVNDNSYSNDASLLLPVNVWTGDYLVASFEPLRGFDPFFGREFFGQGGLIAITASQDDTEVSFTLKARSQGTPSYERDIEHKIDLNKGDVFQLNSKEGDLTGSRVKANKPIQVIGGHICAFVPNGEWACDHLEESMFPVETTGRKYVVTAPFLPGTGNNNRAVGREQVVRVIAAEDEATVTFSPAFRETATISRAGDFIELPYHNRDYLIESNKKIIVIQYMVGQQAAPAQSSGDPAMMQSVPTEQYRTSYLFHAPVNYETSWVNVTAPVGASITLDGQVVNPSNFLSIGDSGFGIYRLELNNNGDGNHTIISDLPVGISVYGYGQFTSYWYPGGLDLEAILPG